MLDYRRWFHVPAMLARGWLLFNSVTFFIYDATDVMDNNNFATVLEINAISLLGWNAQKAFKKVPVLEHLDVAKKNCVCQLQKP